jgi:ribosomal protein L37E
MKDTMLKSALAPLLKCRVCGTNPADPNTKKCSPCEIADLTSKQNQDAGVS